VGILGEMSCIFFPCFLNCSRSCHAANGTGGGEEWLLPLLFSMDANDVAATVGAAHTTGGSKADAAAADVESNRRKDAPTFWNWGGDRT
jgi:hypothetical protein